jgi:hypothetical protein
MELGRVCGLERQVSFHSSALLKAISMVQMQNEAPSRQRSCTLPISRSAISPRVRALADGLRIPDEVAERGRAA